MLQLLVLVPVVSLWNHTAHESLIQSTHPGKQLFVQMTKKGSIHIHYYSYSYFKLTLASSSNSIRDRKICQITVCLPRVPVYETSVHGLVRLHLSAGSSGGQKKKKVCCGICRYWKPENESLHQALVCLPLYPQSVSLAGPTCELRGLDQLRTRGTSSRSGRARL